MRTATTPARLSLLLVIALLAAAHARHATVAAHSPPAVSAVETNDCEGDACSQVALTFDDSKQQYRAQNDSADRFVKVSASNLAASADVCVAPGKVEYLPLKSVVGNYRAAYAPPSCVAAGGE